MSSSLDERQRIQKVYQLRDSQADSRYNLLNPDVRIRLAQRERKMADLLHLSHLDNLNDLRILDLGCGAGGELSGLTRFGAEPVRQVGVDLSLDRLTQARNSHPEAIFLCADGNALPFRNGSFDLVCQFTVFSSILSARLRSRLAGEMTRVLRPGGYLLWYDFQVNNPWNPDVRGVTVSELRFLFSGCSGRIRRLTLVPPLARRIPASLAWLHERLAELPLLQTHLLGLFRKPGGMRG